MKKIISFLVICLLCITTVLPVSAAFKYTPVADGVGYQPA